MDLQLLWMNAWLANGVESRTRPYVGTPTSQMRGYAISVVIPLSINGVLDPMIFTVSGEKGVHSKGLRLGLSVNHHQHCCIALQLTLHVLDT